MNKIFITLIILLASLNHSKAAQIVNSCNDCYNSADAALTAELSTMMLPPGLHSAIIVNKNQNHIWEVMVRVTGNSFNPNPNINDNISEVLSVSYKHTETQTLITLRSMVDEPIVVDTRDAPGDTLDLINSLCPSAHNGNCTALNHHLYNLPTVSAYRATRVSTNLIKLVWNRLFKDDLMIIVIFPDGSVGVYRYNGSISPNSIDALDNTATDSDGYVSDPNNYDLSGFFDIDDLNTPGTTHLPYGGFGGSSGGGGCFVAVTTADDEVTRVQVVCP